MVRPVGVVLAGGAGRRMGQPKGSIVFEGRTLAQRAVDTLAPLCERVLLSVAPGVVSGVEGAVAIEDLRPAGRGPLAGLAAAFAAAGVVDLLVLACDYPFADTAFCGRIVAAAGRFPEDEVLLPADGSRRDHPLVALWRGGSAPAVVAALSRGEHAVRSVVGVLRVRRLDAGDFGLANLDPFLRNWNFPEDFPPP